MKFGNPSKKLRNVASTRGHAVDFPGAVDGKMVFVHVPNALHTEVLQAGMVPESEIEEVDEPTGPVRPDSEQGVAEALNKAYAVLVERADREDFTGSGTPKVDALTKLVGWPVHKADVKDTWDAFQQAADKS